MSDTIAGVAKLADAPDLGSGPERGVGSSPSARIDRLLIVIYKVWQAETTNPAPVAQLDRAAVS